MRKTTTRNIQLVLITSVLASCGQPNTSSNDKQRVFMRADSTAQYTEVSNNYNQGNGGGMGMGSSLLWFMAFRHMGGMLGYANNSLHPQSVSGTNAAKASAFNAQRGGFGKSAVSSTPRASAGS
ncbi:hypothetical protein [Sphingobacterium bovistauri]|uniref:Lipoprotein n=1 Tax=Sphingobacterium bovistauri TaxID=2781959 RepID=A0ABS7Z0Q1_9SPHI|nr:hypothetical protein [Sphingobacterium bovistauri]MCA5003739.1 hypothetical protein [Sphingobacterium bovistauri]